MSPSSLRIRGLGFRVSGSSKGKRRDPNWGSLPYSGLHNECMINSYVKVVYLGVLMKGPAFSPWGSWRYQESEVAWRSTWRSKRSRVQRRADATGRVSGFMGMGLA